MSEKPFTAPPPPTRTPEARSATSSRPHTPETKGQARKAWWSAKGKVWGDRAQGWSDSIGGKVNDFAERRLGSEAFYPVTGDMPKELDKCARILRTFTEEGIVQHDKKNKTHVLRKIPPKVIKRAKGLAIFTSMRSGIAPLGGAGGAGIVVARLPDGSWSAPASITPNNLSTGLLLGVDIYDCVLVINTQQALDSFGTHKVTLGTEIAVVAGPWGAGAAVEAGIDKSPVFSYVKSRGLYAGVEVVGQVFFERFQENALMYHWPGVKARDILTGKVEVPREASNLQQALHDAESGRAQMRTVGGALEVEVDKNGTPLSAIPLDQLTLDEGEVLKLPPTPEMTDGHECEHDPETLEIIRRSGLNPPLLPPRRGQTAPAVLVGIDGAVPGPSTLSHVTVPRTPPPLPHRPGEEPPAYDAAPHVDAAASDAKQPLSEVGAAPLPPPLPTRAAGHTLAGSRPISTASAASLTSPSAPPLPTRAAGHTLAGSRPVSTTSAASLASPSSPPLTTPTSPVIATATGAAVPTPPPRPSTPELIAIGAPAEMNDAERREWEQHWTQRTAAAPGAKTQEQKVDAAAEDESLL